MKFVEFVRDNFRDKYYIRKNIEFVIEPQGCANEIQVKDEEIITESEEDKIRNELMSVSYRRGFVYPGYCSRVIEVNGQRIRYKHYEYFLADDNVLMENVIKLTGDNLDGKSIHYTGYSFCRSTNLVFRIDGERWTLDDDHVSDKDFNKEYISGYELAERAKNLNNTRIQLELNKLAKQGKDDVMFEK